MEFHLVNKKTNEVVAEAVDIGGSLHVMFYDNVRGSYVYKFGQWPSKYRYVKVATKDSL